MKMAALINIVPNIENLSKEEWNINNINNLDTSYIPKTFDIYNDILLAMLLRYRKEIDFMEVNELYVLSVGNSDIDYFLKNIYSYDVDKIIRLERPYPNLIDYKIISNDLYSYIEEYEKFDIILAGKKGMLNGSGLVAYELANLLNYKIINNIIKLKKTTKKNYVSVVYKDNDDIISKEIKIPFIAVVEDVENMFLQIPTLKQKLKAKKKEIHVIKQEKKDLILNNFDKTCFREIQTREGIEYQYKSSEITLEYLKNLIIASKKEKLKNYSFVQNLNYRDIHCFNLNNIKLYFCHEKSKYLNCFIEWNIKNDNSLFLNVVDLEVKEQTINLKKKIYAENLNSNINISYKPNVDKKDMNIISISGNNNLFEKLIKFLGNDETNPKFLIDEFKKQYEDKKCLNFTSKKRNVKSLNIENKKAAIAIGKGISNKKNLELIKNFAIENDLALVGTRQAAMNGFIPFENMVGVSGKQISPNLIICIGVSGAPAFFEGVKNSKKIVSINNDRNAPIFENSDVKIVLDIKELF